MNAWLWAAFAFSCLQVVALRSCWNPRGSEDHASAAASGIRPPDRLARWMSAVVSLQLSLFLALMTLIGLVEGSHQTALFDVPLSLALFSLAGGLVFARFLERSR